MADTKKYLHTLDISRNKVINLLLNPLTTVQRTAVGTLLNITDQGYVCYDTNLNQQYFWDGTQWIVVGGSGGGGTWGSITGVITAQTDLINYLAANYYPLNSNPAGYLTSSSISGMVTGSGTLNYIPKWTPSGTVLGNSLLYDNGTNVIIGATTSASAGVGIFDVLGQVHFRSRLAIGTWDASYSIQDSLVINGSSGNNGVSILRPGDNAHMRALSAPDNTSLKVGGGNQNNVDIWGHTTAIARFTNNGGGRLGILTTSPAYTLDVNGDGSISGKLNFNHPNNTNQIRIGANGNGAGGVSTQADFVVIGKLAGNNLLAAGGTSLVAMGYFAGGTYTSGGVSSVHIGRNSGGGITTGSFNTHVGMTDTTSIPSNTDSTLHLIGGGGYELNNAAAVLSGLTSKYAMIGGGYDYARYINDFYFGAGPFVTLPDQANLSFYAPSGRGANLVGSNFTLNAGRGTGTGVPGDFIIKTAAPTTTGATLQTLSQRVTVKGDTGWVGIGTATPINLLHVNGSARINNQLYFTNSLNDSTAFPSKMLTRRTSDGLVMMQDIPGSTPGLSYHAQYFSYTTQSGTTNNVGKPMFFEVLDLSNGITVVSDGTAGNPGLTKITFANTGRYNLQFSTQLQNLANTPTDVFIWLRKGNATTAAADVTGSTGVVGLEPRKNPGDPYHTITSWNFLLDVIAGDFYQIVWSTSDIVNVTIQFYAGNPPPPTSTTNYPSTASTLFTVTQVEGIIGGTGVASIQGITPAMTGGNYGFSPDNISPYNLGGTDFNISYGITAGSPTIQFHIPTAGMIGATPTPGIVRGLVTNATQTIYGVKTFNSAPNLSSLTASRLLSLDGSKNINVQTGTGLVKLTAGVISYDTNAYLTAAITSLNGLTGAVQTFTNDTNVTMVSAGTAHAITWSGTLADGRIASATNWNTAYTNRITSLTTTGSSGAATLITNVLNIPNYTLAGLGGVPTTRTLSINGTSYDLSADRSWTISGSTMTAAVTADLVAGAINAGQLVPLGTTFQQFVELLLTKIFYPTLNAPSFSLSNDRPTLEIGTTTNVLLTFNFNRGSILGSTSGTWNPSFFQNYRAGSFSSYNINGTTVLTNTRTILSYTVIAYNAFTGTVTYGTGPQPLDSKGFNYSTPLAGATSPTQGTAFSGIYPYYWYKSNSPITAADMQNAINTGVANKVVLDSTGTITINFAAAGEYLAVAYPNANPTKTLWYVNALDNGTIPGGVFGGATTLSCSSSSGYWSSILYKIHVTAGLITQPNPMDLIN